MTPLKYANQWIQSPYSPTISSIKLLQVKPLSLCPSITSGPGTRQLGTILPPQSLLKLSTLSSVQSLSYAQLFVIPWTAAHQASLSITNSRSLLNSCPLSQWCHPIISSSVIPFSSCLQSFPASGSFPINHLFASGGQSIGVSASASGLPVNIQSWFPLRLTDWISL